MTIAVTLAQSAAEFQKNSTSIFPTLLIHAYNPPASVAGVFRETFAGRREPALPSDP
jgi:hypothetical protein